MHTLTINLELDDESFDALSAYTAEWNGENGTSTASDRLKDDAIAPFITAKVEAAYQKAVAHLGTAARAMPYAQRLALIQQVQQQIQP